MLEAWEEPSGLGSAISAMLLDPASGSYHVLGLEPAGAVQTAPAVASRGNNALLLWATRPGPESQQSDLVGAILDSSGNPNVRWSYRQGAGTVQDTALAAGSQVYLAFWTEARDGASYLISQAIGPAGNPADNPILVSDLNARPTKPAVVAGRDGFLAAWVDSRAGTPRIYGALLNASGKITSAPFPISDGTGGAKSPTLAFDGQRYVVAWYDGRAGLSGASDAYLQAVGSDGSLVGANVLLSNHRLIPTDEGPRVAQLGPNLVTVFSGQAIEDSNVKAIASSAVFGTLLAPSATPSVPFALSPIDSSMLVDARTWGQGMLLLDQHPSGAQNALAFTYYTLPGSTQGSSGSQFGGSSSRNNLQQ